MSENLKGVIELEIKTDRFVSGGQKAREEISKINEESKKTSVSVGSATQKVLAFGTALGSTVFAAKNLGDMQLQLRKASFQVGEAQDAVNKILRDGKKDSDEYRDAVEKLQIKQENYKQTLDNIQQAHIQFGFSVATLVATTLPNLIKSLGGVAGSHGVAAGAALANAGAHGVLTTSLRVQLGVMLHHPFFLPAVLAASAAGIALISTNTFGLRDAIFGSTEAIKSNASAMDASIPVINSYGNAFDPGLTGKISNASDSMSGLATRIGESFETSFATIESRFDQHFFDMRQQLLMFGEEGILDEKKIDQWKKQDELLSNINADLELGLNHNADMARFVNTVTFKYLDEAKAAGLTTKELEFQIKHQLRLIELESRKEAAKERARQRESDSKKNEIERIEDLAASYQEAAKAARDLRRQIKDATGEIIYQNDVELVNLKALLEIRDEAAGVGDFVGAQLAQDLIDEKFGGKNIFGTPELSALIKGGITGFGTETLGSAANFFLSERTIKIAEQKHAASVAKANAAFKEAGQKSLSERQARKVGRRHSPNRLDRFGGQFRRAVANLGLGNFGLSPDQLDTIDFAMKRILMSQGRASLSNPWIAGNAALAEARRLAEQFQEQPFLPFGGSALVKERLGLERDEARRIMQNQLTVNDIMGRMAFENRLLLASTSV